MKNLIPRFIHDNYKAGNFSGNFEAVSLFVDISGFTKMTETLMRHGKEGAEALAETLHAVFDPLINAVYAHHGIVTGFAGDAFTALFPMNRDPKGFWKPLGSHAYRLSLAAAHAIQKNIATQSIRQTKFGEFDFAIKIGLAHGEAEWGILRSEEEPYQHLYFFKGSAVDNCALAEHQAEKGDLILSESAWTRLQGMIETSPTASNHFRVDRIVGPLPSAYPIKSWQADPDAQIAFLPPEIVHAGSLGELRQVITLFISLPETIDFRTFNSFIQHIFRLIQKYRGTLARLDFGDKGGTLLIFWGAPVRFENDVERALNFLLDLKSAQNPLDPASNRKSFRAGITRRLMYTGYAGGSHQGEFSCYGRGINMAARMMMKADWGELWLGQKIIKSIPSQFEIEFKGRYAFRGFVDPIPISHLIGRHAVARAIFYEGPLVGRQIEMAQLHEFVQPIFPCTPDSSKEEEADKRYPEKGEFAGMITVYGEAGMGKSRLIYEFRQQLLRENFVWWFFCPCDEILRQSLNPFVFFLKRYFHQSPSQTEAENRQNFENKFDEFLSDLQRESDLQNFAYASEIDELERTRSILSGMLDLYEVGSLFSRLEPKLRFENMLHAYKDLIKALSLTRPVILSIDDMQWIDRDSEELLKTLTRNIDKYPIAIVVSSRYRDNDAQPTIDLDPEVRQVKIDLKYLTKSGIQDVAENVVSGRIDDKLVDFLVEKTQGNPLFVDQMTLNLKEQGLLLIQETEKEIGEKPLYSLHPTQTEQAPSNINDVLISRLDRLPLEVKQVVQTAAVLGWEFDVRILNQILHHDADLTPKMKSAAKSAIWTAKSDVSYIFKHALMRDAAYDMQLRSRLRKLHQLAAEAYEAIYIDSLSQYYADLVNHYEKAENREKTIDFLEKAGDFAKENYKNQDAIGFYDRFIYLVSTHTDHADRSLAAQFKRGKIFELTGQRKKAAFLFEELLKLAKDTGNKEWIAKATIQVGQSLLLKDEYDQAMIYFTDGLALAKELNHPQTIALALGNIGAVFYHQNNFERAMDFYNQQLKIDEASCDHTKQSRILSNIGMIFYDQGEYQKAMDYHQKSYQLAVAVCDQREISRSLGFTGHLHQRFGDYPKAIACYQQQQSIAKKLGDQRSISEATRNMSGVYLDQGDYHQALEWYQQQLDILREWGDKDGIAGVYCNMGIACFYLGDYDRTMMFFEKNRQVYEKLGNKKGIARSLGNMGNVYDAIGDYAKALDCYQQCLDFEKALDNMEGIGKIVGNMGLVYMNLGDYDQAMKCFNEQLRAANELDDIRSRSNALANMGTLYKDLGEFAKAMACYREDLAISKKLGNRRSISINMDNMGSIYKEQNDYKAALRCFDRSIDMAREIGLKGDLLYALINKADVLCRSDRYDEARSLNDEGLALAEEIGIKDQAFKARILALKIKMGAMNYDEFTVKNCVESLEKTLADTKDHTEMAALHYELRIMNDELRIKSEWHRRMALELYEKLWEKTPKFEYKKRIENLATRKS
ncbi:MAG: hypothetical protein B6244_09265 [Candidatus Cloacimonetes bacterium 4572_55]|nr:MAG: hypothetical protein B6244_09265 [Candidatus Cloacimonetes bacterium 4572_55]